MPKGKPKTSPRGRPPKDPQKTQGEICQIRISAELLGRIDADAVARGQESRAAWLRAAAEYYLKYAP